MNSRLTSPLHTNGRVMIWSLRAKETIMSTADGVGRAEEGGPGPEGRAGQDVDGPVSRLVDFC